MLKLIVTFGSLWMLSLEARPIPYECKTLTWQGYEVGKLDVVIDPKDRPLGDPEQRLSVEKDLSNRTLPFYVGAFYRPPQENSGRSILDIEYHNAPAPLFGNTRVFSINVPEGAPIFIHLNSHGDLYNIECLPK